jgi:hypothetical protein
MWGRRDVWKERVKFISRAIRNKKTSAFFIRYEYCSLVNNRIDAKKCKDRVKYVEIYQR